MTAFQTPATLGEWKEAAEALARERAGRSPELFPHALGLDPEPFLEWCGFDALDTTATNVTVADDGTVTLPAELLVAMLATHSQMGIELGLWLGERTAAHA